MILRDATNNRIVFYVSKFSSSLPSAIHSFLCWRKFFFLQSLFKHWLNLIMRRKRRRRSFNCWNFFDLVSTSQKSHMILCLWKEMLGNISWNLFIMQMKTNEGEEHKKERKISKKLFWCASESFKEKLFVVGKLFCKKKLFSSTKI